MVSKYQRALKLAYRSKRQPTREVYELLLAADKDGDAHATYALATWYLFGNRFCKKDLRRATQMLERAAEADIAAAAYDLAVSLEKGKGIKKSLKKAFRRYVQAALLGDAQSHHEVGRMYYHGIGTAKDRCLAEFWLTKAEKLGVGN
jgi:TPR repeat protein